MALKSSRFTVLIFVIEYISISIVHGEPAEVTKCCLQIRSAFGDCNSAKQCLQYAITHYVFSENTARINSNDQFPDKLIFDGLEDRLLNFHGVPAYNEADSYIVDQDSIGQSSENNDLNNIIKSSDGQSSGKDDLNKNVPNFDGQSSGQDDLNINVQNSDEQSSGQDDNPEYVSTYAKRYHKALATMDDETDYATLYHRALAVMVTGTGVPHRDEFCHKNYKSQETHLACMGALVNFGPTAITAVRWAFQHHTLAECKYLKSYFRKYEYITKYMETIIEKCQTNPSKKPKKFCDDIVSKKHKRQKR